MEITIKGGETGMDNRLVPTTLVVKYPDVPLLHKQNVLKAVNDMMTTTASSDHPSLQYEPFFEGSLSSFDKRVDANHDLATAHLILAILKSSVTCAPSIKFDIVCETTEVQRHSLDTKYDLAHIPYIDIVCLLHTYPILWKIVKCLVKHCCFDISRFGSSNLCEIWDAYQQKNTDASTTAGADEWAEFDSPFTDSCGWHGKDGWLQSHESRKAFERGRIPLTEAVWTKIVSIVLSCRRPFKEERQEQSQERFAAFVAMRLDTGGLDNEEEAMAVKYEKAPPKKVKSLRDRLRKVMEWEPILRNNEPRPKEEKSIWIADRIALGGHRFWMMEMLIHGSFLRERSFPERRAIAYKQLVEVACDNAMAVRGRGSAKKYLEAKKIMDGILPLNEKGSSGKAALRRRMFTELSGIYPPQSKSALREGWTEF